MKRLPALAAILCMLATAQTTGETKPIFQDQDLRYQVSYEKADLDMSSRPFAQRILDLDQPKAGKIRIENIAGEPARVRMTVEDDMRNGTSRTTVYDYLAAPELRWTGMSITQKNRRGRVFREESYDVGSPVFKYPRDIMVPHSLWLLVQSMQLKAGKEDVAFIFMNNILMARVSIKVEGRETMTVPAGSFDSWKITFVPWASDYFGSTVGKLVQSFVPSYAVWVETGGRKRIIRFRGVLGQMPSTVTTYYNVDLVESK